MRIARLLALATAFLVVPACSSEAGASGGAADVASKLTTTLAGITDAKTAESAKTQLTSLTDQLGKALETMKSAASSATDKAKEVAGGDLGKMAGEMAAKAKAAVSPALQSAFSGITKEIERLMGNADIKNALGPVLEKLKGLVAG
jgi:hypothetical protein